MRWVQEWLADPRDDPSDRRAPQFHRLGFSRVSSDFTIGSEIRAANLEWAVMRMLDEPVHFRAASTGGRASSVESRERSRLYLGW